MNDERPRKRRGQSADDVVLEYRSLVLEYRSPDDLIPYERNPRVMSDTAVEKVARSISEYGFRAPIVVDERGVIIAGHTRLAAAKRLGLAKVPVVVARGLSEEQARAYRLADNRTADETGWDIALLREELAVLNDLDIDLTALGFDPSELLLYQSAADVEQETDWEGMPEFEQDDLSGAYSTHVHFRTLEDADRFFALIGMAGMRRRSLWWPKHDGHIGSTYSATYVAVEDGDAEN